jgi:hypothetical protein
MRASTDDHRHDIADNEQDAFRLHRRETSDRNHRSEMIEAEDRMAKPGQQALRKGRRHFPTHNVMGGRRLDGEQDGKGRRDYFPPS